MTNIIIGGGIAGIAAALEFESKGQQYILLERNSYLGGHCSSYTFENCVFDEGPHISFTKHEKLKNILWRDSDNYIEDPQILNYWEGDWVPHPVITNLVFLPMVLRIRVILSFFMRPRFGKVVNYKDWNNRKFGKFYSDNFVQKYTKKYWTVDSKEMSVDWVERRIYSPKLHEILKGAFFKGKRMKKKHQHYVQQFVYPQKNGFQEFVHRLVEKMKNSDSINFNAEVKFIDYREKQIHLADGRYLTYDSLISTIPTPKLINALRLDPENSVQISSNLLRATSLTLVDLIYDFEPLVNFHWSYIYDEKYLSTRIHLPYKLSPNSCPPGLFSMQIEIYSDVSALSEQDLIDRIVLEVNSLGISDRSPIRSQVKRIEYANVIFDHNQKLVNSEILPFLENLGVHTAGRFGNWDYSWSDDAYLSGADAAIQIMMKEGNA